MDREPGPDSVTGLSSAGDSLDHAAPANSVLCPVSIVTVFRVDQLRLEVSVLQDTRSAKFDD